MTPCGALYTGPRRREEGLFGDGDTQIEGIGAGSPMNVDIVQFPGRVPQHVGIAVYFLSIQQIYYITHSAEITENVAARFEQLASCLCRSAAAPCCALDSKWHRRGAGWTMTNVRGSRRSKT